jgi:hypothetical protein
MTSNDEVLAVARFYGDRGWRVLPVKPGSKEPALSDWPKLATADQSTIEDWWTNGYAGCGVGICAGAASGLLAIDVDDNSRDKHGLDTLAECVEMYGELPDTPTVPTPSGGEHLYFKWPGFNPAKDALGPDIDVQGEGRFVVAPPSTHPNGRDYIWDVALRPSNIEPAALPSAWLDGIRPVSAAGGLEDDQCGPSLAAAGFTFGHIDNKGAAHWARPGKNPRDGSSVTVYPWPDHRCVFWSTSVPGVETGRSYFPNELARVLGVTEGGEEGESSERLQTRLQLVSASSVRIQRQRWLWRHRVPLGGAAILVGQEGLGKSTIACDLCARATRGQIDGDVTEPVGAVYVTAEDSESATIVPRLMAAGADLDRVHFVRIDELPGGLSIPGDLEELVVEMKRSGARLLVLDPLSVHLGDDRMDAHRERDVRRAIGPLAFAMEAIDGSALGLMHWSKGPSVNAMDRVLGSRAFTAAARAILGVGEDPDNPGQRMLVLAKSNLGRLDVPALTFGITERLIDDPDGGLPISTSGVEWTGEREGVRSSDLFRIAEDSEEKGAMVSACALIGQVLANGPVDARTLDDARKAGAISEITYKRARQFLGVITEPVRDSSGRLTGWVVRLP